MIYLLPSKLPQTQMQRPQAAPGDSVSDQFTDIPTQRHGELPFAIRIVSSQFVQRSPPFGLSASACVYRKNTAIWCAFC
jgi:hypothetical protein